MARALSTTPRGVPALLFLCLLLLLLPAVHSAERNHRVDRSAPARLRVTCPCCDVTLTSQCCQDCLQGEEGSQAEELVPFETRFMRDTASERYRKRRGENKVRDSVMDLDMEMPAEMAFLPSCGCCRREMGSHTLLALACCSACQDRTDRHLPSQLPGFLASNDVSEESTERHLPSARSYRSSHDVSSDVQEKKMTMVNTQKLGGRGVGRKVSFTAYPFLTTSDVSSDAQEKKMTRVHTQKLEGRGGEEASLAIYPFLTSDVTDDEEEKNEVHVQKKMTSMDCMCCMNAGITDCCFRCRIF